MELDECLLARFVDQHEGVHAKALHVAVVERHTNVVKQERKLGGDKQQQAHRRGGGGCQSRGTEGHNGNTQTTHYIKRVTVAGVGATCFMACKQCLKQTGSSLQLVSRQQATQQPAAMQAASYLAALQNAHEKQQC